MAVPLRPAQLWVWLEVPSFFKASLYVVMWSDVNNRPGDLVKQELPGREG